MAKTKKKNRHGLKQIPKQTLVIREEDTAQAQEVLARYHEIAAELGKRISRDQAQSALTDINSLTEAAQFALVKGLAQERERDAADIALALNELSSLESVRKEARRALIQMRQTGIYPQWRVPAYQTSPYRTVESIDSSKRPPVIDAYLDDDDDFDDDDSFNDETEYPINIHGLSPAEVVEFYIRYWSRRQYRSIYSLLAEHGTIRANLSIDEWATRRRVWAESAKPEENQIDYVQELEPEASDFQLFNVAIPNSSTSTRIVEVAWSIIMANTSDNQDMPELPQTLLRDSITDRHWFWTRYMLQQQEDKTWHIASIFDQGQQLLNTPVEVLQQRVQEARDFLTEATRDLDQNNAEEIAQFAEQNYAHIIPTVFCYAALVTKLSEDRPLLEEATSLMLRSHLFKLAAAYQAMLIDRFAEDRASNLRLLAQMQKMCSEQSYGEMDDAEGKRYEELAKESLHKSLAIENSLEAHVLLSELLVEDFDAPLEEAENQLMQAKALSQSPADDANIEIHLGKIDMEQEQDEEALAHFQHAIELDPTSAIAWFNAAEAFKALKNTTEAEASYRRAIELQPNNQDFYFHLSILYKLTGQIEQTIEVLKEGLKANPDASDLQYYLMSAYLDANNLEQFRIHLEEIAQKNPDTPLIEEMRSMLNMHERLSALEPARTPIPIAPRPSTLPRNRMENPKPRPKRKKKKR